MRRFPDVDPAAHPRILEVVLGQSAAKYIQATDWVHKWQQNGVEKYGCLMMACDMESQHRQGEPCPRLEGVPGSSAPDSEILSPV